MSRLYEYYIERLFNSNPHEYAQFQKEQAEHQEQEHKVKRLKLWQSGKISILNGGTVEEWVSLGRPKAPIL
jgi:hypothetical protein|tara:strand:- start:511 stop:723 length:213 start_codon:yes stop_codon:yes gene_type:complete